MKTYYNNLVLKLNAGRTAMKLRVRGTLLRWLGLDVELARIDREHREVCEEILEFNGMLDGKQDAGDYADAGSLNDIDDRVVEMEHTVEDLDVREINNAVEKIDELDRCVEDAVESATGDIERRLTEVETFTQDLDADEFGELAKRVEAIQASLKSLAESLMTIAEL